MAPDIAESIDQLVLMGGADSEGGNITPFAEFNVFADPHAAAVVLGSETSATILSLDVTHQVRALDSHLAPFRTLEGDRPRIMVQLLEAANALEQKWKGKRTPMHDPSTIAFLLAPHLFEGRRADVTVETESGARFGQTRPSKLETGRHTWITKADAAGFFLLVKDLLETS